MKIYLILAIIIIGLAILGISLFTSQSEETRITTPEFHPSINPKGQLSIKTMRLTSPNFQHNDYIPAKYTCDGADVNLELEIQDAPADAKSLALVMEDPDAPGGIFVHWTIWNIDPRLPAIKEDSVPANAIEGKTSFGRFGYGGPCPPAGPAHHYIFKLYALDNRLELAPESTKQQLEEAMRGHILAQAQLIGLYKRE